MREQRTLPSGGGAGVHVHIVHEGTYAQSAATSSSSFCKRAARAGSFAAYLYCEWCGAQQVGSLLDGGVTAGARVLTSVHFRKKTQKKRACVLSVYVFRLHVRERTPRRHRADTVRGQLLLSCLELANSNTHTRSRHTRSTRESCTYPSVGRHASTCDLSFGNIHYLASALGRPGPIREARRGRLGLRLGQGLPASQVFCGAARAVGLRGGPSLGRATEPRVLLQVEVLQGQGTERRGHGAREPIFGELQLVQPA